jgi:hypothetical protein
MMIMIMNFYVYDDDGGGWSDDNDGWIDWLMDGLTKRRIDWDRWQMIYL